MNALFKYNSLNAFLKPSTKSLIISTKNSSLKEMSTEWLFELDSILQWAFDKIEIHSILLTSEGDSFSPSMDANQAANKEKEYWLKLHNKINGINKLIAKLPQTIILDCLKGGANYGLDVAISADILIGHRSGAWSFDYLEQGLSPLSLPTFLSQKVSTGLINQWVLAAQKLSHEKLAATGVIQALYDDTDRHATIEKLLTNIYQQAPVTRIQTKLALQRSFLENLDSKIQADQKILHGTLMSEEWKLWVLTKNISSTQQSPNAKESTNAKSNEVVNNVLRLRPGLYS